MIRLAYDPNVQRCDLSRTDGNLDTDDGLETAVLISLFTDARAKAGDDVDAGADKRGWWAAVYLDQPTEQFGSRLWLLARENLTPDTIANAAAFAEEALQWLIAARVASRVSASAERVSDRPGWVRIAVEIQRQGVGANPWRRTWEVQFGI